MTVRRPIRRRLMGTHVATVRAPRPARAVGSVVVNPRTDRIRKLVVESGSARLKQWLDYERDIRADFRAVFGEEPGPLIGVALMTDSDNTQSEARAWYGPVELLPATTAASHNRGHEPRIPHRPDPAAPGAGAGRGRLRARGAAFAAGIGARPWLM